MKIGIDLCLYKSTLLLLSLLLISPSGNAKSISTEKDNFRPNSKQLLELERVDEMIQMDGNIETIWNQGKSFSNFTEYLPVENRKPLVQTKGYITYDDYNLYISFICDDPDISKLRASYSDRDHIFDDDWVCVSIDPDKEGNKAYEFYANAHGIQGDRLWRMNSNDDGGNYDLVWDCNSQISDDFWSIEMQIPFSSLRFPERDVQEWGIHLMRKYPRENEYVYSWMPITQNISSFMVQAGNISFEMPKHVSDPKNIELLPYLITTQQGSRVSNQNSSGSHWQMDSPETRAGFGAKYSFSSNIVLDFTYNPDFSQIESDEGQVSLNNPFALFYNEKRPFFQEGSDIYVVDQYTNGIALDQYVNLFYSRSINNPLVAGKLSGKIGRMSLGITSAIDQNTPYIIPFEESSAVLATEKNSYNNILRGKVDMGHNSYVGFFLSNRDVENGGNNTVGAFDATVRLSDKDMVTAIAALTYTQEPNDSLLSNSIGENSFKIDDAYFSGAFDGESFNGRLLRAKIAHTSLHWNAAAAYQDFSPGFRADNGFIWTTGYRNIEASSSYTFRWEDHPILTSLEPQVTFWRKYNYDGIVKDTGIRPTVRIRMPKQITFFIGGFLYNRENLRGKQFGDARQIWFFMSTNTTKSVSTSGYLGLGKAINRVGVDGDTYNPFEVVPSFRLNGQLIIKPTNKITNDIEMRNFSLWQKFYSRQIMGQQILRNTFSYNFNKNLFVRIIAEYNYIKMIDSESGKMARQTLISCEPLISYKLNAFSVFYLGAHLGGCNPYALTWERVRLYDQTVYMKMQYLFGF